ncbi:hypothetical protein [Dyella nitratireducens]|uniref:hypothetical protein n=1 Tax=Dyella nitratireducens TaxID=1849580 RepID=UPI0016646B5A|nr:hypothetical protein [Dyella nitratireducens]
MPVRFDISHGLVRIGAHIVAMADMSAVDLEKHGVTFIRDFDMQNGWLLKQASPLFLDGKRITLLFKFNDQSLKVVSFSISHELEQNLEVVRKSHDKFLSNELGPPNEVKSHCTIYRYPWGEISSEVDVRNESCSIVVRWS